MRISNGNFLDEDGNEVNLVELLRTGKATPVVNNNDGHHMSAHSGWFTDENGTPVNIVALIDAAIDEDGGEDEPAIGGISVNGGNVVTPDENGIINLTISGDGSTVIDSELSASSTNPVQNKVVTEEIADLNTAVDSLNGSLGTQYSPTIVIGEYIAIATGKSASSTKYARTGLRDGHNSVTSVSLNSSDYEFCVLYYDDTGNLSTGTGYIGNTGYISGIANIPDTAVKIALSFRRKDQAVLTDEDVTAIASSLTCILNVNEKIEDFEDDVEQRFLTLIKDVGENVTGALSAWKQGTIDGTTGNVSTGSSAPYRCYTNKKYVFDALGDFVTLTVKDGYTVTSRTYKRADNSFVVGGGIPFSVGTIKLPVNDEYYYKFVVKKVDESAIPYTSVPADAVTFEYHTLNESTDIISRNNEIETRALLQQLCRKTRTGHSTFGKKPLCLVHFSDIHGDTDCLANVVKFSDYYASYVDDIIHTGDMVHESSADGIAFWDGTSGAENILNVIGNHDTKVQSTWTGLDMAASYETYFAPYIENWNCTYTADTTYYYKDYLTEGVRLIVLDIMHQTAEQLAWFVSTLESARTGGLDVIVADHARAHWLLDHHECVWDDVPNLPSGTPKDTSAYTGSNYPSNLADSYASAVDDFITVGGYFICWIHGHTHYRILADLQTHPNQLDIAVCNAGGADFARTYVWARVVGTKSMDDFNVIGIDTTGKILRIAKIGVNTDRLMRTAHTMSYNYSTHTVIYAD